LYRISIYLKGRLVEVEIVDIGLLNDILRKFNNGVAHWENHHMLIRRNCSKGVIGYAGY
jgi:hypothetical protein